MEKDNTKKTFKEVNDRNIRILTIFVLLVICIIVVLLCLNKNKISEDFKNINNKVFIKSKNTDNKQKLNNKNNIKLDDNLPKLLQYFEKGKEIEALVAKVSDGDTFTIIIDNKKYGVRLIGVDTPESVHPNKKKNVPYGKIASDYTKSRLEGKKVILKKDVQARDKYGRILAFVYIDGKMYNEELIEEGHAKIMTVPPNVGNTERFKKLQKEAQKLKKGVWNE